MATAQLVRATAARAAAAAPLGLTSWRRPALRALSIGLFLLAWHAATLWDLDFYVRFQNIPSPGDVLAEAIELFSSWSFYGHILASLERIWLGFAIATVLGVALGLLIGWFAFAEDTLLPPIELFRPIPAVAWVPISIMLWPTGRSARAAGRACLAGRRTEPDGRRARQAHRTDRDHRPRCRLQPRRPAGGSGPAVHVDDDAGRVRGAAGPVRLRQDHRAQRGGGLRAADGRAGGGGRRARP